MVRTREKKAKGDSAFTTRKQKVGRKKLAPATATRAEVHARTLRLATSTAMTAAPHARDPAAYPAASETTTARRKKDKDETQRKRPAIAVQSFAELMSGTHHYKSAQRASAFATLTRLLHLQREKDQAAAAVAASHAGALGESSMFDEYMRYTAREAEAAATSGSEPAASRLSGLTALERLKAFAAALEAVTDTDDDVRREALASLEVLVDFKWISPNRDGAPAAAASCATTHEAVELEQYNARLLNAQDETDGGSDATGQGTDAVSATSVDRVQAVLQAIHVALTHAMKPVRLSGVELLALLLRVAPPALVRAAARAVCQQQTSYYHAAPAVMAGTGLTMGGGAAAASPATSSADAASALKGAQARAATMLEEEERWMLTLVRRVSTLVLRTRHVAVLPTLLAVFLGDSAAALGGSLAGAPVESTAGSLGALRAARRGGAGCVEWHHPELVDAFFDDIAPQWANHWKELMELRLELLRQEDKLAMASALAKSFATVLVFLKRQQQEQGHGRGSTNFFSRNRMYYIKALFIEKMPVTMEELLLTTSSGASTSVSAKAMTARLELGTALIMVCVPLAGTDEGWQLMRDYFAIVLSVPRSAPQASPGAPTAAPAPPPFRFPAVAQLEASVRLYAQALWLYPCTEPHLHDSSSSGSGALAWAGDVGPSYAMHAHRGGAAGEDDRRRSGKKRSRSSSDTRVGAAVGSTSSSYPPPPQQQQHSTVAERLLSLFPGLLLTVIRHLVPRPALGDSSSSSPHAAEDAAQVRVLLCVAAVLEQFAVLPADVLRRGAGSGKGRVRATTTAVQRWEEGVALVPRLLFALRRQQTQGEGAPTGQGCAGELLAYDGVVDAVVRRLLRVLWLLGSSGHPLLQEQAQSGGMAASPAPPLAALLAKSVALLFGHGGTAGVLQRCSAPTALLAHSTLFYLGGCGSSSSSSPTPLATPTTALNVARDRWEEVLDVLQVVRGIALPVV